MKRQQIVLKRAYNLAKRELFEAWSQPEIMRHWLFFSRDAAARCTVDSQFVVNGTFNLVMYDRDGPMDVSGNYIEIVHYNFIALTWNSSVASQSLVSLEFRGLASQRTELTVYHQFLPTQESSVMHQQGWNTCLDNLEALVVDREKHMAS